MSTAAPELTPEELEAFGRELDAIRARMFPDLPAHRYAEISVEVREIRERYGIPENTGPLHRQFGSVVRKIVKLALPPARERARKPPAPMKYRARRGLISTAHR